METWTLHQLRSRFALPVYVKDADVSEIQGKDLPDAAFADTRARQYPTHTKAATWISAATCLVEPRENLSREVVNKIAERVRFWGIAEDLTEATSHARKVAEVSLDKLPGHFFAVADERFRGFPIFDRESIEKSAEQFVADRIKLPYRYRTKAAAEILAAADAFGVPLTPETTDTLQRSAGYGVSDRGTMKLAIRTRAEILSKTGYATDALRLRSLANTWAGIDQHEEFAKAAGIIADLDEKSGIYKTYERGAVTLPEDACCWITSTTIRKAAEDYTRLSNGAVYTTESLLSHGDLIRGLLESDEVTREKVASCTPDQADILCEALADRGVLTVTPPASLLKVITGA